MIFEDKLVVEFTGLWDDTVNWPSVKSFHTLKKKEWRYVRDLRLDKLNMGSYYAGACKLIRSQRKNVQKLSTSSSTLFGVLVEDYKNLHEFGEDLTGFEECTIAKHPWRTFKYLESVNLFTPMVKSDLRCCLAQKYSCFILITFSIVLIY